MAISADGRYVVFDSDAYNFTLGEVAGFDDFFVHDRISAQTTMVSVDSMGREGTCCNISDTVDISSDGRYVAFGSSSLDLICGDTRLDYDIMVHDRTYGRTTRVSVGWAGQQGNGGSFSPSISDDGRYVAFSSVAPNLVPGDTNGQEDVFVHDRSALPQKLCVPLKFTYGTGIHGPNPTTTQSDPVNSATGSFITSATDVTLPGIGIPFVFSRTYNSADSTVGALGRGWTHSLAASLTILGNGNVVLRGEDGQQVDYKLETNGSFTASLGGRSELSSTAGGYELVRKDQVRYRFDTVGRLTELRDRNDEGLTLSYDGSGRIASVTDGAARSISFTHNSSGRLTQVSLPDGRSVSYGYSSGRLTSVVDLRGKTTTYAYDSSGRLTQIVDPQGSMLVRNVYNSAGRAVEQYDALGNQSTFSWDPASQTSTMTDARGGVWKDVYSDNILLKRIDPLGNETTYEYDSALNITKTTDARGNSVTMTYDDNGNVLALTKPSPLNYEETFSYDSEDNLLTHTDGRGNTTSYEYDTAGNLTEMTQPGSVVTQFGRDPGGTGLLTSMTDSRGKTTSFAYDDDGNLSTITSPLGNETTFLYDASGRMTSMVEPRGNEPGASANDYRWSYTYDAAGNLLTETSPLGHVTTRQYDDAGNLSDKTDAEGRTVGFGYNPRHQLVTVFAPDGETRYEYDATGNLVDRTDTNDHVTTYQYDAANRLQSVTNPLGRSWTYQYDEVGNLVTVTDARGNASLAAGDGITTYAFDETNRVKTIDYSDGTPDVTYAYDANDNLVSMTDGAGTETRTYDALNRLTEVTRGTDTFEYAFDSGSNVTDRTYPDGTLVELTYDDDGRLSSVTSGGAATTYEYDSSGNLQETHAPNGYTETRTLDRDGRVDEVENANGSGVLSGFDYMLDGVGNPTHVTDSTGTTTRYAYDDMDRLTEVCYSASCSLPTDDFIRYTYDGVGNRLTEVRPTRATAYAYNAGDQLLSATNPQGAVAYAYDENGNQILAGGRTNTYDMANRIVSTTKGLQTTTYAYDGLGKRLRGSSGTAASDTTNYLWDVSSSLPELAQERDGAGALRRRYVHGNDLISMFTGGASYFYHHDRVGSVVNLTSSAGTPMLSYSYDPFGSERTGLLGGLPPGGGPPSLQNLMRFAGELWDSETGLYHLRARQYDPSIGRFLTTDPMAPALTDPYVAMYIYVNNRPTVLIDPSGLFWKGLFKGISFFASAVAVIATMGSAFGVAALAGSISVLASGSATIAECTDGGGVDTACSSSMVFTGLNAFGLGLSLPGTSLGTKLFGAWVGVGASVLSFLPFGQQAAGFIKP